MAESKHYQAAVPTPPSRLYFYVRFSGLSIIGLGTACLMEKFNLEGGVRQILRLDDSMKSMGLGMAIVALTGFLAPMAATNDLMQARKELEVGHPIHHPASGDTKNEDDRILFLYKLRAYENIIELLPNFYAAASATIALGKIGTTALMCVPYALGKFLYGRGYGSGDAWQRAPGFLLSEWAVMYALRGVCILELCRHLSA